MYKKLINDDSFDCCCAYKSNREDEGSLKRTLTSLFYKINNKISDVKLLPGASDFRVFKKSVCDAITSLDEKTRFLKGMFSWVGFNTIYVPYMPEKRMYGTSKWSLFKLLKYSLGGIISFSTKPIKSVFIIGVLALIVGLLNFILMGNLANRTIILFISFIITYSSNIKERSPILIIFVDRFNRFSLKIARFNINNPNTPKFSIS